MTDSVDRRQDTGWLTEPEQQAWRAVLRLRGPLLGAIGRQLVRDSGLSLSDYEVLVALSESGAGVVHVQDLLSSTDWEASRLSHHLTRMQARGLVARQPCPADGRSSEVVITDVGRRMIERAAPLHVAAVRDLFIDVLSPQQLTALADIGATVAERLEPLSTAAPAPQHHPTTREHRAPGPISEVSS
ncbi:MarR family winged helix-turn-helix transcriptional regulator [Nakamurella lactea]|uniref:MarR family winged helix-turn-helix transcriptional regulator n=1 Tax=Nakamurella lactea TaxID=459515 RepID=UPI0003FBDEFB|nr:MarR family winged helix-turn-helix transcriptional regulator [Nakamurella lactea]